MRPAKRVAVTGIAILLPLALYLSYIALVDVAARSGVGHYESYAWPIIVDGVAIVATVGAYSLRGAKGADPREGYRYSWTLLASSAIVSAAANAAHLLLPPGPMPQWVIAGVALVPPIAIVVVAHLAVILARDAQPATPASRVNTGPSSDESSVGTVGLHSGVDTTPMTTTERRAAAMNLREQNLSYPEISKRLGVSVRTVQRDLASGAEVAA